MALYRKEDTQTLFTDIGGINDVCYYCREKLKAKYNNNEITLEEMSREIKELNKKMLSKRIVKIEHLGLNICICADCVKQMYNEIFPNESMLNAMDTILNAPDFDIDTEQKENETHTKDKEKKSPKINIKKGSKKNA